MPLVTFPVYSFVLGRNCPVPMIAHPWLPSAARCFPSSLHRCQYRDRGRLVLPALTLAFPCRQASPSTWGSDFLPSFCEPSDQLHLVQLGEERRHGTGLELDTRSVGETCSQKVPGRSPPVSRFMRHCPTSWGRTCLGDGGLVPMV